MTVKQLDELERKARHAIDMSVPDVPWWHQDSAHLDDAGVALPDRDHIAANSPDVTLRLVAIARAANDACERIGKLTLSGGLPRDVWSELCKLHSVLRAD